MTTSTTSSRHSAVTVRHMTDDQRAAMLDAAAHRDRVTMTRGDLAATADFGGYSNYTAATRRIDGVELNVAAFRVGGYAAGES